MENVWQIFTFLSLSDIYLIVTALFMCKSLVYYICGKGHFRRFGINQTCILCQVNTALFLMQREYHLILFYSFVI